VHVGTSGMGDADDLTVRFGSEPAGPTEVDRTVRVDPARVDSPNDSHGYTVPVPRPGDTRTRPMASPTQPIAQPSAPPNGLPRRIPQQVAASPYDTGPLLDLPTESAVVTSTMPSFRLGKGVTAATKTPRRDRAPGASRRWWEYLTRIGSAIVTVAIVAVIAWTAWQWWQRLHGTVKVGRVTVATAPLVNGDCDIQYDIVGTIATNGKPGTITYEWLRSDGQQSAQLRQSVVAGQTTTTVHLYWAFTGVGSTTAGATLRVLDPSATTGATQFRYSCP
jgi:hypothetical protein